jgi:putative DNA primase/helicase
MSAELLPNHVELLTRSAIHEAVSLFAGVSSITSRDELPEGIPKGAPVPGLLFWWRPLNGEPVPQYRPDEPGLDDSGQPRPKYLFPAGVGSPLNVCESSADDELDVVLFVEGTKQTLAAWSAAPASGWLVVGLAGCYGWATDGAPDPELALLPLDGRRCVVAFDADVDTNRDVWDAATKFGAALELLGADVVRFLRFPGTSKAGLDDYLASVPADRRTDVLSKLVADAGKLVRRPPARKRSSSSKSRHAFSDERGGLLADAFASELVDRLPMAADPGGRLYVYDSGVYVRETHELATLSRELLGDATRQQWVDLGRRMVTADRMAAGAVLPDRPDGRLVNVRNGMLDPLTGELHAHDPAFLSTWQLPVEWDPAARCPTFDRWLVDVCGRQAPDLLESASLMLAPWVPQRRALFLFGPSRSGKSTFARVLERVAGSHVSAVTLHQLATNRFAAAELFGKVLNSASDLSDHHVDDLSIFKMLTGDDPVFGEHKNRDPFTFRSSALFCFTANNPPTVSEQSGAYYNRVRPFLFPYSFQGREDPAVEDALVAELPGIVVRLVDSLQAWVERGGYVDVDSFVSTLFGQQSDVVALFVAECVDRTPAALGSFLPGPDLWNAYKSWTDENGRAQLGRSKFYGRAELLLGDRTRLGGQGAEGWRDVHLYAEHARPAVASVARVAQVLTTSTSVDVVSNGLRELPTPVVGEIGPTRATRARSGRRQETFR